MTEKIILRGPDKILLIFSSIFLMISGLLSLGFMFPILKQDVKLEFIIILTLLVSSFIIGLTLWSNSLILSKLEAIRITHLIQHTCPTNRVLVQGQLFWFVQ